MFLTLISYDYMLFIPIIHADFCSNKAWNLQYSLRRDGASLHTLLSLCCTTDIRGTCLQMKRVKERWREWRRDEERWRERRRVWGRERDRGRGIDRLIEREKDWLGLGEELDRGRVIDW